MTQLVRTLNEVRQRIQQGSKRGPKRRINEENTKATLIEPVLRALAWDVEDFEEVVREFRVKKRDKPVDYGLLTLREPRLFIEAKALGANLDDRRWANQIMGYASVAGVQWIVLTDGNEYRIYNTHAPVAVDQKLFRTVRVTEDSPELVQTLELLAKDRLEENRIEVLWRAQFVDRQVEAALNDVFTSDNDMLLVNYISGRAKDLTAAEIRASLRRCRVSLDFPLMLEVPPSRPSRRKQRKKAKARSSPKSHETTVEDLLAGGLITPGTKLTKTYKGKSFQATVQASGDIKFKGKTCSSPSQAAGEARASVIGKRLDGKLPHTNGWSFWKVEVPGEGAVTLGDLRSRLEESGEAGAVS